MVKPNTAKARWLGEKVAWRLLGLCTGYCSAPKRSTTTTLCQRQTDRQTDRRRTFFRFICTRSSIDSKLAVHTHNVSLQQALDQRCRPQGQEGPDPVRARRNDLCFSVSLTVSPSLSLDFPSTVSVDFNVPMDGDKVTNPQRIVAALPTIKHAVDQGTCIQCTLYMLRLDG